MSGKTVKTQGTDLHILVLFLPMGATSTMSLYVNHLAVDIEL